MAKAKDDGVDPMVALIALASAFFLGKRLLSEGKAAAKAKDKLGSAYGKRRW